MNRALKLFAERLTVEVDEFFAYPSLLFHDMKMQEITGVSKGAPFMRYRIGEHDRDAYRLSYYDGMGALPMSTKFRQALLLHAMEDYPDIVAELSS